MSEATETQPVKWSERALKWAFPGWGPTDGGWVLTIVWLLVVEWIAFQPSSEPGSVTKFDEFIQLKPSEMGDTLAGIFAVLAFVWIIVTVFLQSHELKEQRKEFEKMSSAQSRQVELMDVQTEQLLDQMKDARASQAGKIADRKFDTLCEEIRNCFTANISVSLHDGSVRTFRPKDFCEKKIVHGHQLMQLTPHELLQIMLKCFERYFSFKPNETGIASSWELARVQIAYADILNWIPKADEVTRQKYYDLGLEDYAEGFRVKQGSVQ